jgi:hypothetical protein
MSSSRSQFILSRGYVPNGPVPEEGPSTIANRFQGLCNSRNQSGFLPERTPLELASAMAAAPNGTYIGDFAHVTGTMAGRPVGQSLLTAVERERFIVNQVTNYNYLSRRFNIQNLSRVLPV